MIVVTGGSGYIGSYIVKQLVAQGESVRVMVNSLERARQEGRLAGLPVDMVQGDVTKPATLATRGPRWRRWRTGIGASWATWWTA